MSLLSLQHITNNTPDTELAMFSFSKSSVLFPGLVETAQPKRWAWNQESSLRPSHYVLKSKLTKSLLTWLPKLLSDSPLPPSWKTFSGFLVFLGQRQTFLACFSWCCMVCPLLTFPCSLYTLPWASCISALGHAEGFPCPLECSPINTSVKFTAAHPSQLSSCIYPCSPPWTPIWVMVFNQLHKLCSCLKKVISICKCLWIGVTIWLWPTLPFRGKLHESREPNCLFLST